MPVARTSSFLARPDCKRANATVSAGFGAAAKSWWVPRRSYTVQRGGGAQRRREAEGGKKYLAPDLPGTICFPNSGEDCVPGIGRQCSGGAPATPGLIHGLWRGAGGVARLPTSRDTQHLPPHPQGTKGKRLVGRNPAQPVPCRTLQCESQGWGL